MKIAIIVKKLNIKGGTQRQALSLAKELKKLGHEIKLYTFFYSNENCYADLLEGFEVIVLPPRKETNAAKRFFSIQMIETIREENRIARELALRIDTDIDLLNPHDQVSYKVAYFYKKLVKKVPSVWNMNDLPLYRWGYDKMRGVDETFKKSLVRRFMYRIYDWYEKQKFYRAQDEVVVVDDFNRKLLKKYANKRAITVRNGPDLEHFKFHERKAPGRQIKLLTSGILLPHRRFEDAIRAVKILMERGYDPHLSIIGDKENDKKYYAKLEALTKEFNLENRVTFLGRVSEADLIRAYETQDVYIFQHHLQSDGLSEFEAVATGMPIIVSKTAGCHEVLTDGENALFINPKDSEDIARQVEYLIQNPEEYKKLSTAGNAFVRSNFSWPRYAKEVEKVFNEVL